MKRWVHGMARFRPARVKGSRQEADSRGPLVWLLAHSQGAPESDQKTVHRGSGVRRKPPND